MSILKYVGLLFCASTLIVAIGLAGGCSSSETTEPTIVVPPTPTPTPLPPPTPPPTVTPTPTPTTYTPPPTSELVCEKEAPLYRKVVGQAAAKVIEEHPEMFTRDEDYLYLTFREGRFLPYVIENINATPGYKAALHFYDPEHAIAVKTSNAFSEVYQLLDHGSTLVYRDRYAEMTCRPAEF